MFQCHVVQGVPHLVYMLFYLCALWGVDEDDIINPAAVRSVVFVVVVSVGSGNGLYVGVVFIDVLLVCLVFWVIGLVASVFWVIGGIPVS